MLQGLQPLGRLKLAAVLLLVFLFSVPIKELRYVPIYEALTIKAHKNSPPHVAFEELLADNEDIQLWKNIENPSIIHTLQSGEDVLRVPAGLALQELVISKDEVLKTFGSNEGGVAIASSTTNSPPVAPHSTTSVHQNRHPAYVAGEQNSREFPEVKNKRANEFEIDGLNRRQLTRLQAAKENGIDVESLIEETLMAEAKTPSRADVGNSYSVVGQKQVRGLLEISEGLAVTDENKIFVRRISEGSNKELGQVSLKDGTYQIQVQDLTGSLIAELKDKQGRVLGEGQVRFGNLAINKKDLTFLGPKINIKPHSSPSAVVASAYDEGDARSAPAQTVASVYRGDKNLEPSQQALLSVDGMSKGSLTALRASAPEHLQTLAFLGNANKEVKTTLFPESMIRALYNIVAEERGPIHAEDYRVIWGTVSEENKPLAGVEVVMESFPAAVPVYFNELNIPDKNLTATSQNGKFAFINVPTGYHSLAALKNEKLLGYQNTNVEFDTVSLADIEISKNVEQVPVNVFDAFSGMGLVAKIEMQSLAEDIVVNSGSVVQLPALDRNGLLKADPENADYVSARYIYNDAASAVDIPLVRWDYIVRVKEHFKIQDLPSVGMVMGFMPLEDFDVYLAGLENFPAQNIIYFDAQGRLTPGNKGVKGGGFMIFNVPEDTHEIVLMGNESHKIHSRVIPVDRSSLTILNFVNY